MCPGSEAVAEQVFTALAGPTRRAILATLAAAGPATATDLAGRLPVTRQTIAKHLAPLAGAGLVRPEPGERRRVRYRLASPPVVPRRRGSDRSSGWSWQSSRFPARCDSPGCLVVSGRPVRDHGFGPGPGEDLVHGLGWSLAGGIEPESQAGCLGTEHVVELLDGPGAVAGLAPGGLAGGDRGGLGGEHDDEQRPAGDHDGHAGQVLTEDHVLSDHREPGLVIGIADHCGQLVAEPELPQRFAAGL